MATTTAAKPHGKPLVALSVLCVWFVRRKSSQIEPALGQPWFFPDGQCAKVPFGPSPWRHGLWNISILSLLTRLRHAAPSPSSQARQPQVFSFNASAQLPWLQCKFCRTPGISPSPSLGVNMPSAVLVANSSHPPSPPGMSSHGDCHNGCDQ